MTLGLILALALILDAIFGEPRWLWSRVPHPAVLIGRAIGWADGRFNHGTARKIRGVLLCASLILGGLLIGTILQAFGPLVEALAAAILLAQKSLAQHVAQVAQALRVSTAAGRSAVARIVGRDTATLDDAGIARAAIESGAENLSDGVIAPAFWFLVGGLPAMLAYKAVNTADSMVGYRTPRHQDFGWASARMDDLLNLVPARLTAGLISLGSGRWPDWRALTQDARLHRSPNAGWPEAAMAQSLDVALAGPRTYHGTTQDFPWVHAGGARSIGADDVDRAVTLQWRAWALMLILALIPALILA